MYEQGYEYSYINVHRSTISAYHDPVNTTPVGDHPRIKSVMSGIFNLRPQKPKFIFVWDVQLVLDYLNTLPENGRLSMADLTHKLAMLLALTSASRGSEICKLDIRFMCKTHNSIIQ